MYDGFQMCVCVDECMMCVYDGFQVYVCVLMSVYEVCV